MSDKYLSVPARYYAHLAVSVEALGLDLVTLLNHVGFSKAKLLDPDATLTIGQIESLIDLLLAQTNRTDIGLLFGQELKISTHALVGYGLMSSPTVDYALNLASRFFSLIMPSFKMGYELNETTAITTFSPIVDMSPACRALHIEAIAVAAHFEIGELIGEEIGNYNLYIGIEPPPHKAQYSILKGASVHFDPYLNPPIQLHIDRKLTKRPPKMADPIALRMAEDRCQEMLRTAVAASGVGQWVESMLKSASNGLPSLAELAHTLNLSARTLDRHLKKENVSYRDMAVTVRHSKAKQLLTETNLPITRIALELGYSDSANFTRAFRKIEGCSPSQFRG